MSPSTLSFNPPIRAALLMPGEKPEDPRVMGPTVALIGLVVDIDSGTGQAIIVNPEGQIEWREPDTIELFIEF